MTYRYDCSYPFMDIAWRYGLDYGDVLMAAEWLRTEMHSIEDCPVDEERVPLGAMGEIAALIDLPMAERGGRHEVDIVIKECYFESISDAVAEKERLLDDRFHSHETPR